MSVLPTDFWISLYSGFSNLPGLKWLADRYRSDSSDVPVVASKMRMLAFDLERRAKRRSGTVLGQIDPGPEGDVLFERLRAENPKWARQGVASPPGHF